MKRRTLLRLAAIAAIFAIAQTHGAGAEGKHKHRDRDTDAVRQARERGEILPLDEILQTLRVELPGEIVKVEIERKTGIWFYEFKLVTPQGRRLDVYVNARTKEIVKVEGK